MIFFFTLHYFQPLLQFGTEIIRTCVDHCFVHDMTGEKFIVKYDVKFLCRYLFQIKFSSISSM